MPTQLPFMSDSGGDDWLRLVLPDDNEFADFRHLIKPSAPDSVISDKPQRQDGRDYASTLNKLLSGVSSSASAIDVTDEPISSSTCNQGNPHGNDWVNFEGIDNDEEHSASWSFLKDFQDRSMLTATNFAINDGHPPKQSSIRYPVNPWLHQTPLTPTLNLQSPQIQSPTRHSGNQEEPNWVDYIYTPHEKSMTSKNSYPVVFNNDKTANAKVAVNPPFYSTGSPSFPTVPNLQLPVDSIAASHPVSSTAARVVDRKSSLAQRRQRLHSLAPSQLRPKFNYILPNTNKDKVTHSHISACNSSPRSNFEHKQYHKSGPGAKRSSKSDEEGLRKRRAYQRLAEQTRSHRFNSALNDLEALLPSAVVQEKNQITTPVLDTMIKMKMKEKANSADQTKACVMELAIDYIKMLRTTLREKNLRMRELGVCP